MKQKYPVFFLVALLTSTILLLSACKKLNESTELGGDLIPPIDNINTFDTSLTVEAYNNIFADIQDSIYSSSVDEHFLGRIDNDPLFGKTDARLSLALKPTAFKFAFINRPDSLHIDSIVLALDYVETYGDTVTPQTINVYEISQASEFSDTAVYLVRENKIIKGQLLGSRSVVAQTLKDSVKLNKDTVATARQLRIRLDNSFGARLLAYDSTTGGGYDSDSSFQTKLKGFTLESTGGNGLMGFNLTGVNTKLQIYYKDDNNDAPIAQWDTAVANFTFVSGSAAAANYVKRDYTGTPLMAAQGGATPDNFVYLQNTPGTFATLKVPGLAGLSNRVIHRAELIAEQEHDVTDALFPAPLYMFLDAFDLGRLKYRTVPYDLSFDAQGALNLGAFGVSPFNTLDAAGNPIKTWRFNITRYVQHVVNGTATAYDFRLTVPFYLKRISYSPTGIGPDLDYPSFPVGVTGAIAPLNPSIAKGRVRITGNTGPADTNPRRLRLRLVYSKI